jgi:phosphoglycerate dehydrogenase-like enzyme
MAISRQLKQAARLITNQVNRRRPVAQWSDGQQLRVLIETWPGFMETDWLQSLNRYFSGWNDLVEVRFAEKKWERLVLAARMQVYASTWLTSDFIACSPSLQWVYLALGGIEFLENLEVPSRTKITTASGISADGIAEHVIGLMVALDRRLDLAIRFQKKWRWRQAGILENIHGLRGRTVGVVGLGHNGRAVARLALAMGMRVIGLDKQSGSRIEGVEAVYGPENLPELLAKVDFLVLCVPLTEETRGLIGRKELTMLGRDSYLINVARGGIVDEKALAWALRNRIIVGAALDVLASEPPSAFHALRNCPNLILTPHIAGNIYTFRDAIRQRFVRNLKAFVSGGELEGIYTRV